MWILSCRDETYPRLMPDSVSLQYHWCHCAASFCPDWQESRAAGLVGGQKDVWIQSDWSIVLSTDRNLRGLSPLSLLCLISALSTVLFKYLEVFQLDFIWCRVHRECRDGGAGWRLCWCPSEIKEERLKKPREERYRAAPEAFKNLKRKPCFSLSQDDKDAHRRTNSCVALFQPVMNQTRGSESRLSSHSCFTGAECSSCSDYHDRKLSLFFFFLSWKNYCSYFQDC